MIDLAQADRSMRRTESKPYSELWTVVHDDQTLLGINLTWKQAVKIVSDNNHSARIIFNRR